MGAVKKFKEMFGGEPLVICAPGRINLIGEHTDYNDGFVLPAAINKHFTMALAPNGLDRCRAFSLEFGKIDFSLNDLKSGNQWFNYLMGVMHGIHQEGFSLNGFDLVVESNVPTGAGLSSSAALCCGIGFGLSELFGFSLTRLGLAKIGQYAEHHFAGVNCGIMDQYASLFGKKDCAILLDCRKFTHEYVPVNTELYEMVLVDSKVMHSLASTAYNKRREACETGVALLQSHYPIHSLRDVTETMLDEHKELLGVEVWTMCRYVVREIARTEMAAQHLRSGNLHAFGQLMFETHQGLSQDYKVSCEEMDYLVSLAQMFEPVAGARMMGGGFGGCTLNLVRRDATGQFCSLVKEKYVARFKKEPDFYRVSIDDGVRIDKSVTSS